MKVTVLREESMYLGLSSIDFPQNQFLSLSMYALHMTENALGFFSNEVRFACRRNWLVICILAPVHKT
jgi:hypothetical protein